MISEIEQDKPACTKIASPDAAVLSLFSVAGGRRSEVHVDLKFKKVVTVTTDFDESKPFKRARELDLAAEDAAKLHGLLAPLCLQESMAQAGPPPGGSWYFEVRYQRQTAGLTTSPRILSRKEGVTKGTAYYVLSDVQGKALLDFINAVSPPIK